MTKELPGINEEAHCICVDLNGITPYCGEQYVPRTY